MPLLFLVDKDGQTVTSATLPAGFRSKPAVSGNLYAIGDSFTLGQGSSVPANSRYSKIVAAAKGLTETNLAISGSVCGRWVNDAIASRSFTAGDVILMLPGLNDARYGGTAAANLTQYSRNLAGTICWIALPDANKVYSQLNSTTPNPAMTFSSNWNYGPTWIGSQAQSKCGAYTNVAGEFCQAIVTGDTVHIMLGGYIAFVSGVAITIDGVLWGAGAFSPFPVLDITDTLGGTVWQPHCIRITGLSNTTHVVRVTTTTALNIIVGYIAAYDSSSSNRPTVYVGATPKLTTPGYGVAPSNGNDSVIRSYQNETNNVVSSLAEEGLLVQQVNTEAAATLSNLSVAADLVHPLEIVQKAWAQKFLTHINRTTI